MATYLIRKDHDETEQTPRHHIARAGIPLCGADLNPKAYYLSDAPGARYKVCDECQVRQRICEAAAHNSGADVKVLAAENIRRIREQTHG